MSEEGGRFKKRKTAAPGAVVKRSNTAGLRPPWKPGQSGNPKGKGIAETFKLHRSVAERLSDVNGETKRRNVDEVIDRLLISAKRGSVAAARVLLEWGLGAPRQMIQTAAAVDMRITAGPGIDDVDLEKMPYVEIDPPGAPGA